MKYLTLIFCLLLSGCATGGSVSKKVSDYKLIEYQLGSITWVTNDGVAVKRSVPYDTVIRIKNSELSADTIDFKIQVLFGADCFASDEGLKGSPWAGVRFFHVGYVGGVIGFDKENMTAGADWLYRGFGVGPQICFPFNLGKSRVGIACGILY